MSPDVTSGAGSAYHLHTEPGDIAPFILTSGSRQRIRRLSALFDTISFERENREFLTVTGTYRNIPITGMSTGIGASSTVIAIVEALQCQPQATFIRLGSCGSLQSHIQVGEFVISLKALRQEFVTHLYAPPEIEAVADPDITQALIQAARQMGVSYHCGLTCTTADFYHGQGRAAPGFTGFDSSLLANLQVQGVLNLEMEMAVYLTLAQVCQYPMRAGGVTAVFADRCRSVIIDPQQATEAEELLCRIGLLAAELLVAQPLSKEHRP
ncbi:nucleoside phosphorylase [Desulfobacca acetoxidans]